MKPLLSVTLLGLALLLIGCIRPQPVATPKSPDSAVVRADVSAQHVQDLKTRIETAKVAAVEARATETALKAAGKEPEAAQATQEAVKQEALAKVLTDVLIQERKEFEDLKAKADQERKDDATAARKAREADALQASVERVRFYGLILAGLGGVVGIVGFVLTFRFPIMKALTSSIGVIGGGVAMLGGTAAMLAPALAYSTILSQVVLGIILALVASGGFVVVRMLILHRAGGIHLANYGHRLEEIVRQHVPDGESLLEALKEQSIEETSKIAPLIQSAVDASKVRLKGEVHAAAQKARDEALNVLIQSVGALHTKVDPVVQANTFVGKS